MKAFYIVCTLIILALAGCNKKESTWTQPSTAPSPQSVSTTPSPTSSSPSSAASNCETVPTIEKLTYGSKTIDKPLPATGRFVVESHIKTAGEKYGGKDGFPKNAKDGIEAHLALHCGYLKLSKTDCMATYKEPYMREWTPRELGGDWGQGSSDYLPTIEEETWTLNQQEKKANAGKYLASYNGKNVVVLKKVETGPESPKWLGGMQAAAFYVLGADDESMIRLARLKSQDLPLGPIQCK